jgi:hypothetical protein
MHFFQYGMDFQSIPLHIVHNFQHFEPIQYVNGLSRFLPTFQVNDSNVSINLDDFPSRSKSMMQQPPIQLSQLKTPLYRSENFDYALMDILKINWDSLLKYVVSLFNSSYNTNITIIKN